MKMRQDVAHYTAIQEHYPSSIILVRYEDYILHTNETLRRMYQHFGEIPHPGIIKELYNSMHSRSDGGAFGLDRKLANASLHRWTEDNSAEDIRTMTQTCHDVLLALNYPIKQPFY